jgi:DNA modification methylase
MTYTSLSKLSPDPKNPRLHSKKHIRQLAASIKTFGFITPVIVDAENNIICGHGRFYAAMELGFAEVPTICAAHLTQTQIRAFIIADNRLTEVSEWNDRLLAEQLKILSEQNLDFSIEVTGFEMGEIDLRIEELSIPSEDKGEPADTLPLVLTATPVTQPGDLWLFDKKHRIYCGSALEEASYTALMQGKRAGLVFTDPPYNVPIDGNVCGFGSIHHREFVMAAGEMSKTQFIAFLSTALGLLARHSLEGSIHYICMDWRHMEELLTAGQETYEELKNLCVWSKDNAGMGSLYRSQHELVFVFKKGGSSHRNNVQLGKHGRNRSNIWRYPSVSAFGRRTEEGSLLEIHPTVKPVGMVADAILDCSARGDIILDSFLGSGTTLLAAERTGRRCHGIEMDAAYVDAVIRRFQKYTGQAAVHAATGQTFDEIGQR